MNIFELVALLLVVAAAFSYVNHRLLRLPSSIGVMILAMALSLALIVAGHAGLNLHLHARALLDRLDFRALLIHGMLAFLLFAGALGIDLGDLSEEKHVVALLATAGVVWSAFAVGALAWGIARLLGLPLTFLNCLLLGTIISPTDPIAVLAILKSAGIGPKLQVQIAGESLFNDAIGLVLFTLVLNVAAGMDVSIASTTADLAMELGGGVGIGLLGGLLVYQMMKHVDQYQVEILLTLALAAGVYAMADRVHASGPIAVIVAGLLIGNRGRALAMSEKSREHLDSFWELIDDALNVLLFLLIGLQLLITPFSGWLLLAAALVIPAALLVRWAGVWATERALHPFKPMGRGAVAVITWSGVRGGLSVAMALGVPGRTGDPPRDTIIALTYCVVVFSLIVQGLTVGPLARRWTAPGAATLTTRV